MGRTKKETTALIAKTIKSIRHHKNISNLLIQKECAKNGVSEKAVTIIGRGSGKKIMPFNKADYDE